MMFRLAVSDGASVEKATFKKIVAFEQSSMYLFLQVTYANEQYNFENFRREQEMVAPFPATRRSSLDLKGAFRCAAL